MKLCVKTSGTTLLNIVTLYYRNKQSIIVNS